jgi:pimeloyl-ACP methyl ester carboxylesterase
MLDTIEMGEGPRALFVHGSVFDAPGAWEAQAPLAESHRLLLFNRRGYGKRPAVDGDDFDLDAEEVADALGAGAQLVGHSYGGVVALLAAARRPEAVFSLAVSEPPAFALTAEETEAQVFRREVSALIARTPDPYEFLKGFLTLVGSDISRLPDPVPEPILRAVPLLMNARQPWEAQIPLEALRETRFPKLVISGGHSRLFDAPCDVLEAELPARRVVIRGAGHSIPRVGKPYNDALLALWRQAEAGTS